MRLVLVLLLAGCHKDPLPPPTLDIADPSSVPDGAERVTCRVGPKQSNLALDDAGLHLRFMTDAKNVVTMFGRDVTRDTTLPDALARIADGRANEPWTNLEAKVTSPDGQSVTVKIGLHVDAAMNERIDAARGKAMVFSDETQTSSANKLAWVHPAGAVPYMVGEGRWRDIDLVAFETASHLDGKDCGSVPNGWNQTGIIATGISSHVDLYDRRSGKLVDQKKFDSPAECGHTASNDEAIRAWVSAKVGR